MNLLKRITSSPFIIPFVIFLSVHVFLININKAEWGDSYRILRASDYVRNGTYPMDEKRPPLFSMVLAARPQNIDPILSARLFMFGLSLISFVLFYLLLKRFVSSREIQAYILLLYAFNPVYLYWSIRIYADTFFAFLVLLTFWIWLWLKEKPRLYKYGLIGFVCGLAVVTRFEGYLLTAALGMGLFLQDIKKEKLFRVLFTRWREYFLMFISFLITVLPYFLYKNPLATSYIGETSGRVYDVKMIWTYLVSLLYLFGFTTAFYFIIDQYKIVRRFFSEHLFVLFFIILELLLILFWPAAVPRLFAAVIPLLLIILGVSLNTFDFKIVTHKKWIVSLFLLCFYAGSQIFLKGQFLIVNKPIFAIVILLQIFSVVALYLNKKRVFMLITILSAVIWSLITIYIHKDIYEQTKEAALYADIGNPPIVHNDINSVIEWYAGSNAYYCDKDLVRVKECILKYNAQLVIFTNDADVNYKFDSLKYPYLKLVHEFKYEINGGNFDAQIYAVDKGKML